MVCHRQHIHWTRRGTADEMTGKFVSESKFVDHPSAFIPHIQNPNRPALEALITKPEVEQRLLLRLRKKAEIYAQDFAAEGEASASTKIDVDGVVDLYESYIIPLTKEIEVRNYHWSSFLWADENQVDYLLQRLEGLTQEQIDELAKKWSMETISRQTVQVPIRMRVLWITMLDTNNSTSGVWYTWMKSVHW